MEYLSERRIIAEINRIKTIAINKNKILAFMILLRLTANNKRLSLVKNNEYLKEVINDNKDFILNNSKEFNTLVKKANSYIANGGCIQI